MTKAGSQFLNIAGVCAIIGPVVLLSADLMAIFGGLIFEWTIGLWVAFMLMIPAIIGFTYLIASNGSRLAVVGGAFAFFGLVAGASMQVLFRVYSVLAETGSTQTIEQLRGTFKLVASTQMIGLAWPIGLILLAVAYFMNGAKNLLIPLLLIAGAISFPIGRIAGSQIAVILSGAVFIAAFGLIGRHLFELADEIE